MKEEEQDKPVASNRTLELIVGAIFLVFGAVVVWDSRRLGAGWASDGPQAGYFPFYIGLFICASSIAILVAAVRSGEKGREPFVMKGQLRMVLAMLLPTIVYIVLIANPVVNLGIYVASAIYIAFFMRWLGKYLWWKTIAVSLGTMIAFFVMFEIWFSVPLPKGVLETALGFN